MTAARLTTTAKQGQTRNSSSTASLKANRLDEKKKLQRGDNQKLSRPVWRKNVSIRSVSMIKKEEEENSPAEANSKHHLAALCNAESSAGTQAIVSAQNLEKVWKGISQDVQNVRGGSGTT
jgi:hypothetical protein